MSKTKKIIIIVSMVLVLGAAAYINIAFLSNESPSDDVVATGNFFTSYRNTRQNTRSEELTALEEVMALEGNEYESVRTEAAENKMKLVKLMETELLLENLIKSKGYEDVVVNMGLYSDNINIVIKKDNLTKEDTALIYSIIVKETGVNPEVINFTRV